MSEALSAEDLKAIRERANHAGGGPWKISQHIDGSWLIRHYAGGMVADAGFSNANADFIAHSRTDIPALLAEIERLKAENAELQIIKNRAGIFIKQRQFNTAEVVGVARFILTGETEEQER